MLNNPYFWAGEIGLVLLIISGCVLMHQHRADLLAFITLWFLVIMALYQMVHPVIYLPSHQIPAGAYLFRLAVGVSATVRMIRSLDPATSTSILKVELENRKKILKWASVSGVIALYWIYWRLKNNR